ncbi:MAG: AEC family transporter [Variovorax sp.]
MNAAVVSSLLPVVLVITLGFLAGKRGWVGSAAVSGLSNLVFLLLGPALLFRAMSTVQLQQLRFTPVAAYFFAVALIFGGTLALQGFNRRAAVLALGNSYSNSVMIGIALITLAYGEQGRVQLLTLVSLHSLLLLTSATVVLELALSREYIATGGERQRSPLHNVVRAIANSIFHPVQLPILLGLAFAQTGWTLSGPLEQLLAMLGQAFGPMALLLVGVTLAHTPIGAHWRGALMQAGIKNFLHPVLVVAIGWALGVRGLPLTVMTVVASLPIGANVFLFAQRYRTQEELITASVAVSTLLALVSVSLAMTAMQWLT